LNLLRRKGYNCEIVNPVSGKRYKFVGCAFVDDTDLVESSMADTSTSAVTENIHGALDTWEEALKAICGAFVPEKTFWYLIDFKSEAGVWCYCSIAELLSYLLMT
jgi:hypothetical protein